MLDKGAKSLSKGKLKLGALCGSEIEFKNVREVARGLPFQNDSEVGPQDYEPNFKPITKNVRTTSIKE